VRCRPARRLAPGEIGGAPARPLRPAAPRRIASPADIEARGPGTRSPPPAPASPSVPRWALGYGRPAGRRAPAAATRRGSDMPRGVLAEHCRAHETENAGEGRGPTLGGDAKGRAMQELRLVAVSEDGTYLVLASAGRGTRFTLPVDDRLRAAVRGQFS